MRTVLIAETHAPTRDLVSQALGASGWRVICADDPSKAFEAAVSERPDAVVVGVDFPRLQGATLGKLLRGTESGPRLPIVALDKGHLGKAKGVGAILDLMVNAYVADATKGDDLLAKLNQLVTGAAQAPKPTKGVAATLNRAPVATGDFKSRTLPQYVHSWYRLQRDGVLVAVHRDLTRRVYFSKGAPVNYDSTSRVDALEGWMVTKGLLSGEKHTEMLSLMKEDGLSAGAALVAVGAVEAGEPLMALLREWARAKTAEVYAMGAGRFSFHAGNEFASEVPSLDLPALSPMYEAVRGSWPTRAFASSVSAQLKRFPYRTPEFAKDLAALGLSTGDLKIALSFTGRQTLADVLAESRDLKHALALFWFLGLVGSVKYSEAPSEATEPAVELESITPRRRKKKKSIPPEKAAELSEEGIRILISSYFRALGLDISADSEAVERAYNQVATRFHPDTWAEFELGPLEDLLVSVQDRLSAAYRVLSEEPKRKAYVHHILTRADVARAAEPSVDAEIALKRGENFMKKGDWKSAMLAFEEAVSLNPREPEYYSFLAWATFKAGAGDASQRAKAASRLLKKALAMHPELERPQVIAAIIEDEVGDPAEARRMLLKILKANPESLLAKKVLQGVSKRRGAGEKA